MQEEKSKPNSYALLIGINLYQQLSLIGAYENRSLKGCVRDIQEIKKYLENIPHVKHIQMLTASVPDEHFSPSANLFHPIEEPELWPTYENIISSLDYINSSAKPGDSVYIHFSGHGTSKGPTEPLMLVLFDRASNHGVRYLRGSELTQLLSNMVDKKLTVTLVLDCCQSGGVMRNDSSIRFLEYDPLVDAAYPSSHLQYLNPAYRHISTYYDTLRNPNGYTIITASGPHEKAQERDFSKNEQYHGALSYFLLKAWRESGGPRAKQQLIYEYLSTRVRNTCLGQNPMCYGANNQGFFGGVLTEINQTSILVVRKPDKSIQLQAGHIHGICDGDQFSLYPFGDINPESREPIIAKVIHVRTLVSDLKLLNIAFTQVRTGWVATPLTRLSLRKFPIQIQLDAPYLVDWETARKEHQSLNIIDKSQTPKQPPSFLVIQNNENGYDIKDESSTVIKQPNTTHHKRGNPSHILDIIEHIARFKLVSNMVNEVLAGPTNSFRESFNIKTTNSAGNSCPECSQTGWFQPTSSHRECVIEVEDGDRIHLHVQNKGDYDLYVYILSLGPLWEIENALHANHAVIRAPRKPLEESNNSNDWKKRLKIRTPDIIKQRGQNQHEEVIKVFLTTRLTSFASLELPELGKSLKGVRPNTNRAIGGDGPPEDWAAVNFRIRVSSK
ncbi:hypothetical protein OCU04_012614 [Sclerotinia nivalis]|uniref:Peptidase C14 caspase domain-containing protein n=1 Tax=Sclerotinia nivalis TaxID=352851 RepID=A0A9X0DDF6_9HELO|nr:hypothetical protein OCU04_012614 [Sclerotinia nivalis]